MEIEDINGKISIKQQEINLEKDQKRKYELQNQLQILNIRKQIEMLKTKIQRMQK